MNCPTVSVWCKELHQLLEKKPVSNDINKQSVTFTSANVAGSVATVKKIRKTTKSKKSETNQSTTQSNKRLTGERREAVGARIVRCARLVVQ